MLSDDVLGSLGYASIPVTSEQRLAKGYKDDPCSLCSHRKGTVEGRKQRKARSVQEASLPWHLPGSLLTLYVCSEDYCQDFMLNSEVSPLPTKSWSVIWSVEHILKVLSKYVAAYNSDFVQNCCTVQSPHPWMHIWRDQRAQHRDTPHPCSSQHSSR